MKTVTIYTGGGACCAAPGDVHCPRPWRGNRAMMTTSAIGGKLP